MDFLKRIIRYLLAKLYPIFRPLRRFLHLSGRGVKVIILHKNRILLIKNSYRDGWTLPGGGVKRSEIPIQAAIREVKEEVGLVVRNLKNHGVVVLNSENSGQVSVYSCETNSDAFKIDNFEVEKAEWVDLGKLSQVKLLPVAEKCLELSRDYLS